jgi:hypothetical protein
MEVPLNVLKKKKKLKSRLKVLFFEIKNQTILTYIVGPFIEF